LHKVWWLVIAKLARGRVKRPFKEKCLFTDAKFKSLSYFCLTQSSDGLIAGWGVRRPVEGRYGDALLGLTYVKSADGTRC